MHFLGVMYLPDNRVPTFWTLVHFFHNYLWFFDSVYRITVQ